MNNKYQSLREVLNHAFERASKGKGDQRHGSNKPFRQQDICTELRELGLSPAVYQIRKKAKEALRLEPNKGMNEFLDVIVYAAAAYIVLRETESKPKATEETNEPAPAPAPATKSSNPY